MRIAFVKKWWWDRHTDTGMSTPDREWEMVLLVSEQAERHWPLVRN
jgi:hypothetical protein